MNLSNLAKFILGFTLAIALTISGALAASLYLVARLTALPPKPDFSDHTATADAPTATTVSATPTPAPAATPTPTPTPTPEAGLYRARVTWPEGLTLRQEAGYEATSIGGVAFNETVLVLEEAENGAWQRVRSTATQDEGWVVGGNLEPLDN
ncbi:SH3 domain-containing protein [Baaleninema sp.]|uniref:SH3 domain-containing protein n=1 Tax=Baaleninema sp. TaxID=3101197 RepID=UPI003D00214F